METVSYIEYLHYLKFLWWLFLAIGMLGAYLYSSKKSLPMYSNGILLLLFLLMIFVLGAFPILEGGADRNRYLMEAEKVAQYGAAERSTDFGYYYVNRLLTLFPMSLYFYLHSAIYVLGVFVFSRSLSKEYSLLIFLGMILNFQFVGYGVNTMRAGLAESMVLIAIACRNKKYWEWVFLILAVLIHKSFALPAVCYIMAKFFDKTNLYFYIWLLSIPLSAIAGGYFQELFGLLLGEDERASYLTTDAPDTLYYVGFRIDFIIYSCIPIAFGYYLIYKRMFQDEFYKNLFNMYLLANTFWILVIRANFSDRFAFLSWFLYGALLLYPFTKDQSIVSQPGKWVSIILVGLTLFRTII